MNLGKKIVSELPTWEEVSKHIEQADHDWCESLDQNTSIIKEGNCIKIISREQNSTSKKGKVVELEEKSNVYKK